MFPREFYCHRPSNNAGAFNGFLEQRVIKLNRNSLLRNFNMRIKIYDVLLQYFMRIKENYAQAHF